MSAIQQILIDHIDIWTAAETEKKSGRGRSSGNGVSVYGIKKLRELILELAVRGKLVPQDPNDEPASELLKRIQAEKAKLIAEGKIKKDKPLPPISDEEKPFELPQGWEWVRFGDALISRDAERIPVSSDQRQFQKGEFDYYGASGIIDKIDKYIFDKPLLLIGEDGANLINRSTPIAFIARGKYWVNNHAHVLDGITEEFLRYIELYINAIDLKPYVTGTAQPKMNQAKMNSIVLGLPTEEEQHRIVAKVDELMALCNQLETQHNNAAEAHEKLVSHLLDTLTQSQSADDFNANWQRIAAHFDTLFTTEASIDALKQTLLQLAVMGKLVPQDPNDESTDLLLNRIKKHELERISKKEIQKPKKIDPDIAPEIEIPSTWRFRLLNDLAFVTKLAGFEYTEHMILKDVGEVPVIRAQNVRPFRTETFNLKHIDLKTSLQLQRCALDRPALLMTFIGAGIGDVCAFYPSRRWHLAPNVAKIEPFADTNLDYLVLYLNSPDGRRELFKSMKSTAQPSLSMATIRQIWISLPPLPEQHRIVTKVDELMALCEQLKSRITAASLLQQKLANVVVEQATAS